MESCESEEGRDAIEEFWLRAIDSRCEGLMIKVRIYYFVPLTHWKSVESFWTMTKFWNARDRGRTHPENNHYPQRMSQVRLYKFFSELYVIWVFPPKISSSDKRTSAWLKLKKDYVTGLGDTLDVVPIGAWHGNGRKAQWWSPVLLAIRDTRTDRLVALCKCMSGELTILCTWTGN